MEQKHQKDYSLKCKSKTLNNTNCTNPSCFFCSINDANPNLRKTKLIQCFKQMSLQDDHQHVLALSSLWTLAMIQPQNPEFPSLGIFESMAKMIEKGLKDKQWLLKDQNIYIPYYAAHIIGSYTMNTPEFAEKAINSGVIRPLIELLKGKITWVEQRVALRALGHLASHKTAFKSISEHREIIEVSMELASNCFKKVYKSFLSVKDSKRLKYHSDLLTRGLGGAELENRKAQEWASQIQLWSLYLLNFFACNERFVVLMCNKKFLKDLCGMWSGLGDSRSSPGGIGVIKSLCNTKIGRERIANTEEVIINLCHTSRSSDDWKDLAIDSLLILLKDSVRYKVIDIAALFLSDLVELPEIGDVITQTLLLDYHKIRYGGLKLKSEKTLKEIWDLKVERVKREKLMSPKELKERRELARVLKQQGNKKFWSGKPEKAIESYTKALELCPLKMRKERMVLYSNRAQGYLVLRNPDSAISDCTRALSLSGWVSPHCKSLWRRCQAYDMKGMAKESLMDCLMFVNGRMRLNSEKSKKSLKNFPVYAVRMINKQMNATWPFANDKLRVKDVKKSQRIGRKEMSGKYDGKDDRGNSNINSNMM